MSEAKRPRISAQVSTNYFKIDFPKQFDVFKYHVTSDQPWAMKFFPDYLRQLKAQDPSCLLMENVLCILSTNWMIKQLTSSTFRIKTSSGTFKRLRR